MALVLELPPEVERQIEQAWNGDMPRRMLEAVVAEGYHDGTLSRGQVSEALGLSFHETEVFLKQRGAYLDLTVDDVERGRSVIASLTDG